MENSDFYRRSTQLNEALGVNKISRNIRKSPLQQASFSSPLQQASFSNPKQQQQQPPQPQPQAHVYNISKNDFRNVVQQLTGSTSHNAPKPPTSSLRLQKIRPPPLSPISPPLPLDNKNVAICTSNSNSNLPLLDGQFPPPLNADESPVSAYMRYLQASIIGSTPRDLQSQAQVHDQQQPAVPITSQRGAATAQLPSPSSFLNFLSPSSPFSLLSPAFQLPSPNFALTPLSQNPPLSPGAFLLSSPSSFLAFSSPRWTT